MRFAARSLRKTPGFTLAIILTLALGFGATTVVFSAVEALVIRKLPVADPGRLVVLQEKRRGPNQSSSFSASTFCYDRYPGYRAAAEHVLSGLAAQSFESFSVRLGGEARSEIGLATSGNYFQVLGIRPALGRFCSGSEDEPDGANPVAVVGYDFWRNSLGGDSSVIGRTLFVDSRPLTIIGVAPRAFHSAFAGLVALDVRAEPLTGGNQYWGTRRSDRPDAEELPTQWGAAGVGLIELLRVPLLAGRTFTIADDTLAPDVAVINETMARRLWPGSNPREAVGQGIESLGRHMTVVGVMANGKYTTLQEEAQSYAFVPFVQWLQWGSELYIRARGSPSDALTAAREELAALDPNIALDRPTRLTDDVNRSLVPQRLGALFIGIFGLVGLFLAMTGLYGVLAYGVTQRLREFGVRIALGATGSDIVRLVVTHGLLLVAGGILLGLAGAYVAGRLVAGSLFGLSPRDVITLTVVPLVLLAVALLATLFPARRAAAADPMESLRAE